MLIAAFFFSLFGILGVQLFKGVFPSFSGLLFGTPGTRMACCVLLMSKLFDVLHASLEPAWQIRQTWALSWLLSGPAHCLLTTLECARPQFDACSAYSSYSWRPQFAVCIAYSPHSWRPHLDACIAFLEHNKTSSEYSNRYYRS